MMQETVHNLTQQGLPGERERLRLALLTDQQGILTTTLRRLSRIAQARGVDPCAIDDVVQQTLLEAWGHLDRLTSPAGFHLWIDEICRNVCRRAARSQQTQLLHTTLWPSTYQDEQFLSDEKEVSPLANIPDQDTPDPFEILSRQELMLLLDRALGLLPQETRQIVEMYHLQELSHSEVAERLGISVGALHTRLHRARRQLRQLLRGPLHDEAAVFGLAVEQKDDGRWLETSMWCSCCGRHRLQGSFMEGGPEGNVNLHIRCPGCAQRYGLDTVHSMGLVSLGQRRSFRPAWKRTLQGLSELILLGLRHQGQPCPWCGNATSIQVADAEETKDDAPAPGPYRFWIHWSCMHCGGLVCLPGDLPSVDQIVAWSDPQAYAFVTQHPHWLGAPTMPLEYAGQAALRFQITDTASAASLNIVAHRHNLRVLAVYSQ
ncbi:MAG TPA: sigma-70 family RNA polymerase sigma factor [Ktedonobacteraceae bacterium]|nr:sigma-70 family RNA polymerase sigma factor [Ktedonobacteraceae bacterium]